MQIGAELVFLQIQPQDPLIRADRKVTPMSRHKLLSIRSGNRAERSGIAVRPSARKPRLSGFDIDLSGHRERSSQQRSSWKAIEFFLGVAAQCLAFYGVGRFPSCCSCQLTASS